MPPPPPPPNPTFLIRGDDGLEYGPVDLVELRGWVQENRAGIGTDVRRDEPGAAWHPWQNYPELLALLAEVSTANGEAAPVTLVIAPMGRRVLAFGLDLVFIGFLVTPVFVPLAYLFIPDWVRAYGDALKQPPYAAPELPLQAEAIATLIYYFIVACYFAGFQAAHGQTPAKTLLRLRVVDETGQNPRPAAALLRALVLSLSMNFFLFIPLTYAFFNPQRRALHDFIAGTYVVRA
ncbi:MAG: RDD family protein [Verrucomicrobiota bacterium]